MKLSLKLLLLFGVLIFIAIFSILSIFYIVSAQAIDERIYAQLESVAILKENQFNLLINENREYTESLAQNFFLREQVQVMFNTHSFSLGTREEFPKELQNDDKRLNIHDELREVLNVAKKSKNFQEFFIIDLEGVVHLSTDKEQEGKNKNTELYFTEGKKKTYVHDFYYSVPLQMPATTIATPIRDKQGNLLGVLAARVNIDKISELMLERSGLGETGETILVNKNHLLVSTSRFIEEAEFKKTIFTMDVNKCLAENDGSGEFLDYRAVLSEVVYKWIPERNVCLITKMDHAEAYLPIFRLIYTVSLPALFMLILMLGGISIITQKFFQPIAQLQTAAKEIGKGKLDTLVNIKTKDEIGELADSFRTMARNLKKYILKSNLTALEKSKMKEAEKSKSVLEKMVRKKTEELEEKVREMETFNKITVGRELKMAELKKKINKLEGK